MKIKVTGTRTVYTATGKPVSSKIVLKVKHFTDEQPQPAKRKPRKAS